MYPSQSQSDLPQPEQFAREHSEQLRERILAAIDAADGALPFSRFMDMALYEPGFGYYSAGAAKFGAEGDFVTAVDQGDFLARAIVATLRPMLTAHAQPVIVEIGAGSGTLAHAILGLLDDAGAQHVAYRILETSPDLRARQAEALRAFEPRVSWIDTLEPGSVNGAIIANEVADALPVDRVRRKGAGWEQLTVGRNGRDFLWQAGELTRRQADALATICAQLPEMLPEGYQTEIRPLLADWVSMLAGALRSGEILLIDYGMPRREYFHPQRSGGTLMCHYRHRAHGNPFLWPGLQDITAWVDFSDCAYAGQAAGLHVVGYATQGSWIAETLASAGGLASLSGDIAAASQLRTLLLPGEMGERFKALLLRRFSDDTAQIRLPGRDLRSRLW